jgi:phosphoribosylformylglycinamidine (FGAM) synthase-like amidotransferase family enzyme
MQDSTIVHQDRCLTVISQNDVILVPCAAENANQKWLRKGYSPKDPLFVVYPEAKDTFSQYSTMINGVQSCLTHMSIRNKEVLGIMPCSEELEMAGYQSWSFTLTLDFAFAKKVLDGRKHVS